MRTGEAGTRRGRDVERQGIGEAGTGEVRAAEAGTRRGRAEVRQGRGEAGTGEVRSPTWGCGAAGQNYAPLNFAVFAQHKHLEQT